MNKSLLILFLPLLSFLSCDKEPGVGGASSINGTLVLSQYNDDFSVLVDQSPAQDIDVFIQYGDNELIEDKVETSPDGYFEFNNLYEGDYTLIYYSEDSSSSSREEIAIEVSVSLGNNQNKELGAISMYKSLDYDDGLATIRGVVRMVSFRDTTYAVDQPVFLRPLQHNAYAERIRTQGGGVFYFENLIPGDYEVFVFSEDKNLSSQDVAIKDTMTITRNVDQVFDFGDIFIYNW